MDLSKVPSQPLRRPRKSSSNSRSSVSKSPTNRNLHNWYTLQNNLLNLDKNNYTNNSKALINKLQNIIQSGCSESSNIANAVLYIIYERSIQELILQSFPVSASIIDSLVSSSSDEIVATIQPLIQEHLTQLQTELQSTAKLSGTNVGVICLLINMWKLEQLANRASHVTTTIQQILKDTAVYVEFATYNKEVTNDALIILLFCLTWFGIRSNIQDSGFIEIKSYIRKSHIKHYQLLSPLGRVLAIDIIEQIQNVDNNAILYSTMYKKIINTRLFLLSGIEDFISGIPYPLEDAGTITSRKDSRDDDVFCFTSCTPEIDTNTSFSPPAEVSTVDANIAANQDSGERSKNIDKKLSSSSSISSIEEFENEPDQKWARKISNELKELP